MESQSSENSQIKELKSKIKIDWHLTKQERDDLQESYKKNEAEIINATKNELKSFISQDYWNANKSLLWWFNWISKLQEKLWVKNDWEFWSDTFSALIKFQKENWLTTDWLAWTETQIKLWLISSNELSLQNKPNTKTGKNALKNDWNSEWTKNTPPSQIQDNKWNQDENTWKVEKKNSEKDENIPEWKVKNNEDVEKNTFDIYKKRLETIRKNLIDWREDILRNYKKTWLWEKAMDSVVWLFTDNVKKTYEDLIKRNNSQALSFLKSFILKYDEKWLTSEEKKLISDLYSDIKNIANNNTLEDLSISEMWKNSVEALPETWKLALKWVEWLTVWFFEWAWNAVKSIPDFIKLLWNLTLYIWNLSIDSKTRDELVTRCNNIIERVKKLDWADYEKVLKMFQVWFDNFSKLPPEEQAKNIWKLFWNIEAIIWAWSLVKTAWVAIEANWAIKTWKILRIAWDLMSLKSSKVWAWEDFIKTLEYWKKFYFTYENWQTAEAVYMWVSNVWHHIKVAWEEGLRVIEFWTAEAQMFWSKLDQITNMLVKSWISKWQELIPESIIKFFSHEINLPWWEVIMKNLKLALETTKNISKEQLLALVEKINSIQSKFAEIIDFSKISANKIKDMINLSLKEINTFLTSINFSGLSNELQKSITDSFDKIKKKYNEIEDIIKNKYSELTEKSTWESIKWTGSKDLIKKLDKINNIPLWESLVLHTKNSTYILEKTENWFILTGTTNIEMKGLIWKDFKVQVIEWDIFLKNSNWHHITLSKLDSFETKRIEKSENETHNSHENKNFESWENDFVKEFKSHIKSIPAWDSLLLNTIDYTYILEKTENWFILKDTNNPEFINSLSQKIQFLISPKGEILLKNQDKKVKLSELLSFEKKQKFNPNMNTAWENLPKLTETEIKEFKKKIRSLFMKYHPDKNAQESEKIKDIYTEIIKEINLVNEKLEKWENMIADYNKLISETIPNYERKINEIKKPKWDFNSKNESSNISSEELSSLSKYMWREALWLFNDARIPKPEMKINVDWKEFLATKINDAWREYVLWYTKVNWIYEPRFFYFSNSWWNWHCSPWIDVDKYGPMFSKWDFLWASYEKWTIISTKLSNAFNSLTNNNVKNYFDIWIEKVWYIDKDKFKNKYWNEYNITKLNWLFWENFSSLKNLNWEQVKQVYNWLNIPKWFDFVNLTLWQSLQHKYLWEVNTYVLEAKYMWKKVEIVFWSSINNKPDLVWVEDIRYTDSKVNSHWIPIDTFNSWLFTTKPLEYVQQTSADIVNKSQRFWDYVDIREYIQENPLIKLWKSFIDWLIYKKAA